MAHHETENGIWTSKFRGQKLEMFSSRYYAACAAGGLVSAGSAHLLITPFDVLKVNMQANPVKYRGIWSGFGTLWKEQGFPGLWRGWGGKLYGYGGQGACKFGFYEYFKKLYCDVGGPTNTNSHKTLIYLAGSASAEVIADVFLCPFEAIKVRVQTQPGFAKGLADGFPKLYKTEGLKGFYKGLVPLWGRNLPFAMIMFSSFEHSVDFIYDNVLHKRKMDCSKGVQLGVTTAAGYASGVAGSIVSNPADNIITYIYNNKGHTVLQSLKAVGWIGLFTRSLPLRIMLVGPLVTVQWFCVDSMKILMGLYFKSMRLTQERDVYSFGIVLLELISAREPADTNLPHEQWKLSEWVRNHLVEGKLEAIVDKASEGNFKMQSMWLVAELAMTCVEPRSIYRPTISEVVLELEAVIGDDTLGDTHRPSIAPSTPSSTSDSFRTASQGHSSSLSRSTPSGTPDSCRTTSSLGPH